MGNLSLEKNVEKVKLSLEKHDVLVAPIVRVGEALDISGSMTDLYRNGSVANVVFRTLALAMAFDDNGEMDMRAFGTSVKELPVATPDNFESYVDKYIVRPGLVGGGTKYSPCLRSFFEFYFPESSANESKKTGFIGKLFGKKTAEVQPAAEVPALVLFITDGENDDSDNSRAEQVLIDSQGKPIYWLMIGIGTERFSFIKKMADAYPNVGFLQFNDLNMSDEALYDGVINEEFVAWVTKN
jgi:hypothetical protein